MSHVWWYAARSAGIVSWILLALSVVWGVAMSGKVRPLQVTPAWMLDLHRFLGALSVVFVGVHVGAIVLDSYVHFGPVDVLVPFASSWKPVPVAWGVVGVYLLLAIELTSLARRRLPNRWWRRVHFLSYPLFVLATVHGLTAGTDRGTPVLFWSYVGAVVLVAALTAWRVAAGGRRRARRSPVVSRA